MRYLVQKVAVLVLFLNQNEDPFNDAGSQGLETRCPLPKKMIGPNATVDQLISSYVS